MREAILLMKERGGGAIVNMSFIDSKQGAVAQYPLLGGKSKHPRSNPRDRERTVLAEHLIGRARTAEEIAAVVSFLFSHAATHVVGEALNADGGYLTI